MCIFCDRYGDPKEGGGLWYLNPKNYARNMYKLRAPNERVTTESWGSYTEKAQVDRPTILEMIDALDIGDDAEYNRLKTEIQEYDIETQVVPLKDALKILELCSPIGIMACICRKCQKAIDERNEYEYTCMGTGVGLLKWERWPERYKGGVKFLSVEEAKEWVRTMDKRGFCHMLMLYGAPYVGGLCNCDYPDCRALRRAVDFHVGTLKGHYVAQVDLDLCNGCRICVQRCQWGALKFEVTSGKAGIDQFKCFGCGLCETSCPRGAISLLERKILPNLKEVWR